jgi:hypothetical protein
MTHSTHQVACRSWRSKFNFRAKIRSANNLKAALRKAEALIEAIPRALAECANYTSRTQATVAALRENALADTILPPPHPGVHVRPRRVHGFQFHF